MIQKGIWQNLKTSNRYIVTGTRVDRTNATEGRIMVDYENHASERSCREVGEFTEKFKFISGLM